MRLVWRVLQSLHGSAARSRLLVHADATESLRWLTAVLKRMWPSIDEAVQKIVHAQVRLPFSAARPHDASKCIIRLSVLQDHKTTDASALCVCVCVCGHGMPSTPCPDEVGHQLKARLRGIVEIALENLSSWSVDCSGTTGFCCNVLSGHQCMLPYSTKLPEQIV